MNKGIGTSVRYSQNTLGQVFVFAHKYKRFNCPGKIFYFKNSDMLRAED